MFGQTPLRIAVADLLARASANFVPFERLLSKATRSPLWRDRLHVGAVAHGYPRVLGRPEFRVADLNAYRFYVNVAEPLGVQSYFFGESCTLWFTRELVRERDTCIDAGANVGHYAFALATAVGEGGRVVAVEANPDLAALIERSIRLNQFERVASVERRALWSSSGETMRFLLSVNSANTGTSSLVNHGVYLKPEVSVEVTTVTLDDLLRELRIEKVRLLKLDVERAEHQVLQGAEETLANERIDYLIIEMHAGSPAQALLEAHGYTGWFVDTSARRLLSTASLAPDQFGDFLYLSPSVARAGDDLQRRFGALSGK